MRHKAAKSSKILAEQFALQGQRVNALKNMLEKSENTLGKTHNTTLKWKQAVNEATAQLNYMEREMKEKL